MSGFFPLLSSKVVVTHSCNLGPLLSCWMCCFQQLGHPNRGAPYVVPIDTGECPQLKLALSCYFCMGERIVVEGQIPFIVAFSKKIPYATFPL